MDEGHRRQSSIAAPRHPPSGPPNGDRSTTELEKGKKTREQQLRHLEKRERDKTERVRIRKETILGDVRRKLEEERKKKQVEEQKMMEVLREKEKREEYNDRLKAFGYTDEP